MKRSAAVVVIGGGVIGASAAYHLAARGAREVAVLDRAPRPGAGSTGRATGGFRVQFPSAIEVRLSLLALDRLRAFGEETGGDCGYLPHGYLWVAETEPQLAELRRALAVQHANEANGPFEVDCDAIAALNRALRREGVVGGTYCASDGFISPLGILDGYRRAAERLGVRFRWNDEAIGMTLGSDGRVASLSTTRGELAVESVVNAAGPWAARVAGFAGVALPVVPLRRQVAMTAPTGALPARMPMTIYAGDGFHLRERDGRALLLKPSPGAADPFDAGVDDRWVDEVTRVARARVPALAEVAVDRSACWAGLYEMSPDGHAILGAAPGVPNLFLANGSSGHGVMHAPALGLLLAELVLDGEARSLDVTALRPDRFGPAALKDVPSLL